MAKKYICHGILSRSPDNIRIRSVLSLTIRTKSPASLHASEADVQPPVTSGAGLQPPKQEY
ncbi:hypothetical protein BU25DRAFT_412426 [Macroventuria anomochaeta]|uniref:Uncharacterized protein n=1 Tax=Macroventuria anomochaeta TaxID=301207 RepID=A0ACB6RXW6_9PLEO|nr:uncharacterized protein BU25DRAFT_412426 [Macroventuria anomochaeta]KAF2625779.1 hypothetical protein BU25DRAFT_412426 [Macroventuria anomochaeta]